MYVQKMAFQIAEPEGATPLQTKCNAATNKVQHRYKQSPP
jgi:hypothetical protein